MTNYDVIKASGCIHISHKLSLVQQQLWNLLLNNAYKDLLVKKEHTISEASLRKYLDNTRNQKYLKNIIAGLQVQVHYNILNKDTRKWGFFSLLAYAEIENGICRYAFVDEITQLLYNPKFYAKISLLTQKKFKSKYALFLYELCIDYSGVAQTPWISLSDFRHYMGLYAGEYQGFKSLSQHIIDKAVLEVNECSDISVTVTYNKVGKWISDIKFLITKKERPILAVPITPCLPNSIISELIEFGIPASKAQWLADSFSHEQIQHKVRLLKANNTKIHNSGAWLIRAIEENWNSIAYEHREDEQHQESMRKEQCAKDQRHQLIETIKKEYDLFIEELALQRFNSLREHEKQTLEDKFTAWFKDKQANAFFRFLPENICRKAFLTEELILPNEKNFINWTQERGNL